MFFGGLFKLLALFVCFIFASGFFAGAARSCAEEKWSDFGTNFMLALCYVGGMLWIVGVI